MTSTSMRARSQATRQPRASGERVLWFVGLSLAFSWTSLAVLAHGTFNGWYEAAVRWLAPEVRQGFMSFSALLTAVLALVAVWRCGSTHLSSRTCHIWPT